jgi:hypothetical protein
MLCNTWLTETSLSWLPATLHRSWRSNITFSFTPALAMAGKRDQQLLFL